ncbi:cupin domain-containing protein [Aeoliella sp. SH292]|uniref:cupin domain-containing protein n=1 Tax=Aeoliella sp. SH292 TaxID=3454464 RepID=UPI003F9D7AEB
MPTHLWFLHALETIHTSATDGSDGVSLIEHWVPAGDSPPLHIHHTEDEIFYILEGEFRLHIDGKEQRVGPGASVLTPRGIPHTYRAESPEGGRFLTVTTHGDFERLVRLAGRPAERPERPHLASPPTPEEFAAFAKLAMECNIELVGPPLE